MNTLIDFLNSHGSVRRFTGQTITADQEFDPEQKVFVHVIAKSA